MHTLRYLRVDFDLPLQFSEVAYFRGAIADRVGPEHILFHHHFQNPRGEERVLYRYPMIQYKQLYKHAAILCLGEAVDEIHHLFAQGIQWDLRIGKRQESLKIQKLRLHEYRLEMKPEGTTYRYTLNKWLALNGDNYRRYQKLPSLRERLGLLENILANHILSFAKGVGWQIPTHAQGPFSVSVEDCASFVIPYKRKPLSAFSLTFRTNIFLPSYIGLGKGASQGYGLIKFLSEHKQQAPPNVLRA